ncbi:hypothetical protein WUBG_09102, partial [Wuchereria bancrofti]
MITLQPFLYVTFNGFSKIAGVKDETALLQKMFIYIPDFGAVTDGGNGVSAR